jgi:hypothetical protein
MAAQHRHTSNTGRRNDGAASLLAALVHKRCHFALHRFALHRPTVYLGIAGFENRFEVRGNRTGKGWFVKGRSANPGGRPKNPAILREYAPDLTAADRRPIPNLAVEARRFSGLAIDTLVELTKAKYSGSMRCTAATALLDRGYGRPAQSLDLHLSADAISLPFPRR